MADLLASLAARSLGQLHSMQPRRASRFQNQPDATGASPLTALDLTSEPEPAAALHDDGPPVPPAATEPRLVVQAANHPEVPRESPRIEPPRDAHPRLGSPAEIMQDRSRLDVRSSPFRDLEPGDGHDPQATPANSSTQSPPDDVTETEPHRGPEGRLQLPSLDRETEKPDSPHSETARWIESRKRPSQSTRSVSGVTREPVHSSRSVSAHVLRVSTGVAVPNEVQAGTDAHPEPPAPNVTVSIGRIEVKAARPPEPTLVVHQAAPPQSKPQLSLDEYLDRARKRRR